MFYNMKPNSAFIRQDNLNQLAKLCHLRTFVAIDNKISTYNRILLYTVLSTKENISLLSVQCFYVIFCY